MTPPRRVVRALAALGAATLVALAPDAAEQQLAFTDGLPAAMISSMLGDLRRGHGHQHPETVLEHEIKLLHYTLGGPWRGHLPDGAHLWMDAFRQMIHKSNPCGSMTTFRVNEDKLGFSGSFTRCEP